MVDDAGSFYLRAFSELSTCRQVGFDAGPIPWRDVVAYADRAGLDDDNERSFVAILRELDEAYLKHRDESSRAQRGGSTSTEE